MLHGNNAGIPKWKLVFSVLGLDGYLLPLGANFYKIGEWFLGCLLLIYLLFPLLRRLQNGRRRCLAATAALGAVWLVWPLCCPPPWDAAHTVLGRVFVFWCGMLAARVLRAPRRLGLLAALAGGGAVLALAALPWPGRWPQPAALCAALLVLALAGLGGPGAGPLAPRGGGGAALVRAAELRRVFGAPCVFDPCRRAAGPPPCPARGCVVFCRMRPPAWPSARFWSLWPNPCGSFWRKRWGPRGKGGGARLARNEKFVRRGGIYCARRRVSEANRRAAAALRPEILPAGPCGNARFPGRCEHRPLQGFAPPGRLGACRGS